MSRLWIGRAASTVVPLPPPRGRRGLTPRDCADFQDWAEAPRRVELHTADEGDFALLYEAGVVWAKWGVTRADGAILLWNAVTLEDIGAFPSVPAALSTLSDAVPRLTPSAIIIPFPLRAS